MDTTQRHRYSQRTDGLPARRGIRRGDYIVFLDDEMAIRRSDQYSDTDEPAAWDGCYVRLDGEPYFYIPQLDGYLQLDARTPVTAEEWERFQAEQGYGPEFFSEAEVIAAEPRGQDRPEPPPDSFPPEATLEHKPVPDPEIPSEGPDDPEYRYRWQKYY